MQSSLLKAIQVLEKKDRITMLGAGLASPRPLGSGGGGLIAVLIAMVPG